MSEIQNHREGCKGFGSLARALVLNLINTAPDDHIRKLRIMIAREEGILSEQEATDWIAILDLREA